MSSQGIGTVEALSLDVGLSARECEVLFRYAEGKTNALIADELGISEVTVRQHLSRIRRRLRAEWELRARQQDASDLIHELAGDRSSNLLPTG